MARTIVWFSAGAASAIAAKLVHAQAGDDRADIVVARIFIPSEHEDNDRFSAQCERWFNHPIVRLRSFPNKIRVKCLYYSFANCFRPRSTSRAKPILTLPMLRHF